MRVFFSCAGCAGRKPCFLSHPPVPFAPPPDTHICDICYGPPHNRARPRSCVRLPDVLEAYEGTGSYTKDQRKLLVTHLEDPEQRKHPWPAKLDVAFGKEDPEELAAKEAAAAAAAAVGEDRADRAAAGDAGAANGGGGGGGESAASPKGDAPGSGSSRGPGGRFSGKGRRAGFGGKGAGAAAGMAAPAGGLVLLGSPMVDATLEDTQGLKEVIEILKRETGLSDGANGGEGASTLRMEVCMMLVRGLLGRWRWSGVWVCRWGQSGRGERRAATGPAADALRFGFERRS